MSRNFIHGRDKAGQIFTEYEIRRITSNYGTLIGKGGFGEVYKGVYNDDCDLVAVKRCIHENWRKEFMEEVSIHSQMKHKNVVKLIGHCFSESNLTLITEYITKGSLDNILHNSNTQISLDTRLGIAIGCAEALRYMHSMHLSSGNYLICHGDIKPANILLDENFTAKVSDFGLSRLLQGGISRYTNIVIGSIDYMDPICLQTGRVTPKSDVYSFGIVLLELIARKRAKEGGACLVEDFASAKGMRLRKLFDSAISSNKNDTEILQQMVKLANECLNLNINKRPEINSVAKCLRALKSAVKKSRIENKHPQSILATHRSWHKKDNPRVEFKKSPSFFKRNSSNFMILLELNFVRSFTKEELNEVTENYSYLLGEGRPAKFYKGTLEDNTAVVVRKFLYVDYEEAFINGEIILSQINNKNIIKLLGYCLEADALILIYEFANKGSLRDIFGSHEDFVLDKRMRIAIKTAEALQYLHSGATGIIGHGSVAASTILLDNNLLPKLTNFSRACKLIKETGITSHDSVITRDFLEKVLYTDPTRYMSVLKNLESDVYMFGGILFTLISREKNVTSLDETVDKFTNAYQNVNSGKAIFDKDITSEEDIIVLEALGKLALKCTILDVDKMVDRPTMKEVVEKLHVIRRSWERTTEAVAAQVIETETSRAAVSTDAEPRLPNLMRHIFGYRRIQCSLQETGESSWANINSSASVRWGLGDGSLEYDRIPRPPRSSQGSSSCRPSRALEEAHQAQQEENRRFREETRQRRENNDYMMNYLVTLSQKLDRAVPEFRPPQPSPQVPPTYFSGPINQGPPLGDAQGWHGSNALEFRPAQLSPQVAPNYFITTPSSQGSPLGDAQGSQPSNQIIPSAQGSQPQQWIYPTQGPPFGDASQSQPPPQWVYPSQPMIMYHGQQPMFYPASQPPYTLLHAMAFCSSTDDTAGFYFPTAVTKS